MNELDMKIREAENLTKSLLIREESASKQSKINAIHKICKKFVDNNAIPSISLVVKSLLQNGVVISKQSIYNKQSGNNPYRKVFDIWLEVSKLKSSSQRIRVREQFGSDDLLDENDFKSINDPVLRYRINLMYGELKALKKQNDMLRDIREMPSLQTAGEHAQKKPHVISLIDSYDKDVITRLLQNTSSIGWDDTGRLIASSNIRSGTVLSSEGLKEALKKLIDTVG